ncbi:MAG TPA: prenyltransferase/squalene oxidase repeat-containing protein [Solirubrobacterales bacterium]|nr:prenyltransferase/squalene oxidase repeat-containing protein [Solirubrobacterales bacterium]
MSWQVASFLILAAVLLGGFVWYERSRPTSQIVALVGALAALAVAGRLALAAIPNVVATTDIAIFAGYALGPAPGFAVGAFAGLVSNFWLGQGPWTPWQMAGWGMCGVFGALLALGFRNAGRFTLAAACGLAGIAYGALLNFSLMATYGGELSLERFLALESRAVPFDLAHAIGNVVIALIAGPAMVRMLVRFRQRFQWRAPALAAATVLALIAAGGMPSTASAADTGKTVGWLLERQNSDGGWGPSVGDESSVTTTAWVMLGLEAANRSPFDVQREGRSPIDFLRANVEDLDSAGDFARTIIALDGAGADPRSFGGHDLVRGLLNRRATNGSYVGWPGTTAFAVIALRAAGATGSLDHTSAWLAKVQNPDGGWGDLPQPPSTADGTGAVLQAIPHTKPAVDGLEYLRRHQRANGGFVTGGNGAVNAMSTAWAVQGMLAVGADPSTIREGGDSALDYLRERRARDGHYTYSSDSDQTAVWVTAQVLAAVAGEAFPIDTPPARLLEPNEEDESSVSPGTVTPPPLAEAEPLPGFPESSPEGTVPPGSFESVPGVPPTAGSPGGAAPFPTVPGPGSEGVVPEGPTATAPAAPPFEASPPDPPEPLPPIGIGLGTGGLALGGALLLGRRFGW